MPPADDSPAAGPEPTVVEAPPELKNLSDRALAGFHGALNEGDAEGYLEFLEPDVDFSTVTSAAEGVVYHGHDEVRQYIGRVREAFEETRIEAEQQLLAGDDVLVVLGKWFARGRGSGVEIVTEWGSFFQLSPRNRATCVRAYTSHEETLVAAREQAAGGS